MDSWGYLGFLHILAAGALVLAGSETAIIFSQFFGGLLEVAFAVYLYQSKGV